VRAVLAALAALAVTAGGAQAARAPARPPAAPWQYQLQGTVDTSIPARVFDVDGAETPAATVRALRRSGRYTVCYFSAGTYERFRSDRGRLRSGLLGRPLEDFPGERWLDIRRISALAPVMRARMRTCARKGFQAVEPDNVDGYANRTGFPLRRADALRYTRWLARTAHRMGLAVGLKNSTELVRPLVRRFDFAVVEQCLQYDECEAYRPFVRARKPVYVVEYEGATAELCPRAARLGVHLIRKDVDLAARPYAACPSP
jgi:hypothetical protein